MRKYSVNPNRVSHFLNSPESSPSDPSFHVSHFPITYETYQLSPYYMSTRRNLQERRKSCCWMRSVSLSLTLSLSLSLSSFLGLLVLLRAGGGGKICMGICGADARYRSGFFGDDISRMLLFFLMCLQYLFFLDRFPVWNTRSQKRGNWRSRRCEILRAYYLPSDWRPSCESPPLKLIYLSFETWSPLPVRIYARSKSPVLFTFIHLGEQSFRIQKVRYYSVRSFSDFKSGY